MSARTVPELLAPAGSLEAVRAAVANGADAVYLGVGRFNARDDAAQLTLDELAEACRIAHGRGRRVYLTLNVLVKPRELVDALELLGEAADRGIDAVIVQDLGLITLIRRLFPLLSVHGSTQMTVHDASGARIAAGLGVERVVLARENTLADVATIRDSVPNIGLEAFVHGALCISYSGQCYMSGLISERSANRGSCAQSCRKDYVLTDVTTGEELDRGYLISARDLGGFDHLAELADAGISCLKVEGRKKRPEYVAVVSRTYRSLLDAIAAGEAAPARSDDIQPLVQIYSRGFTPGMLGGRVGRDYVTRDQPDNRGERLGTVVHTRRGELTVEVSTPIMAGDGLGFQSPDGGGGPTIGFHVQRVRTERDASVRGPLRQVISAPRAVPVGWTAIRTSRAQLVDEARASYVALQPAPTARKTRVDVRLFGSPGSHLRAVFSAGGSAATARSAVQLVHATSRALDLPTIREHLGRLGDTSYVLGAVDTSGLTGGLFLPVSELNRLRQAAIAELGAVAASQAEIDRIERRAKIENAVRTIGPVPSARGLAQRAVLSAEVFDFDDARRAADAGAGEICLDPFLRHPVPSLTRAKALAAELEARGVTLRLRTPTIVRPPERRVVDKWLDLGLPVLTGHLGLAGELGSCGRDVVADYAVNCFNQHTAAEVVRLGVRRVTLSIELTVDEMADVVAPFPSNLFEVVIYGRPEGMTVEHCVLSAAFDRVPTSCRDLCVRDHTSVELTDPSGYAFAVATDSACRNRLLHSRPVDGAEYLERIWAAGVRSFRCIFNVRGDPVASVIRAFRQSIDALAAGDRVDVAAVRQAVGPRFTRGHFARAV